MKLKLTQFLPGALLTAVLLGAPILFAQAQSALDLKLTDSQKTQLKAIQTTTHSSITQLLTAEQQAQLTAAEKSGQHFRKALSAVKLTNDQIVKVHALQQAERQQEDAVLTPEQQQKIHSKPSGG